MISPLGQSSALLRQIFRPIVDTSHASTVAGYVVDYGFDDMRLNADLIKASHKGPSEIVYSPWKQIDPAV